MNCCRCGKSFDYEKYNGICPKCAAYNRPPGEKPYDFDVQKDFSATYAYEDDSHARLHRMYDSAPVHQQQSSAWQQRPVQQQRPVWPQSPAGQQGSAGQRTFGQPQRRPVQLQRSVQYGNLNKKAVNVMAKVIIAIVIIQFLVTFLIIWLG